VPNLLGIDTSRKADDLVLVDRTPEHHPQLCTNSWFGRAAYSGNSFYSRDACSSCQLHVTWASGLRHRKPESELRTSLADVMQSYGLTGNSDEDGVHHSGAVGTVPPAAEASKPRRRNHQQPTARRTLAAVLGNRVGTEESIHGTGFADPLCLVLVVSRN